jgi:hypothetical protein
MLIEVSSRFGHQKQCLYNQVLNIFYAADYKCLAVVFSASKEKMKNIFSFKKYILLIKEF